MALKTMKNTVLMIAGFVAMATSVVAAADYYWTGAAESYDLDARTPKTSTLGNWTLEGGAVPTVAPGVDDTLIFTNRASSGKNGRIFLHDTGGGKALFAKIVARDEALVTLYGGTDIQPYIPSEGVWNYTQSGYVYFDNGTLATVAGTSTSDYYTNIVYAANTKAYVVNNGKYQPGSYSVLLKQGQGHFQSSGGKTLGGLSSQVLEEGTYRFSETSGEWTKTSFMFLGDKNVRNFYFTVNREFVIETSLTEKDVTKSTHKLTDYGQGATLILKRNTASKSVFASSRFSGILDGTLSLVFESNDKPACTLTLAKGTSTSTGALRVNNGSVFLTEGATYRTLSGVTVGNGDATYAATLTVEDGASLKCGTLDIASNGTLSIAAGLTVEADDFTFHGDPISAGVYSASDNVGISGGGRLYVGGTPNLAIEYDPSTKVATTVDRTNYRISHDDVAENGQIQVSLSSPISIPDDETNRLEIAEYSTSAGLLPGDFRDVTAKTDGLPITWFETEEADGVLKVYLVSRPVITASFTEKGTDGSYYFMKDEDKAMWSDGKVPHAGADYLIALGAASRPAFYDTVENGETSFPGETLTMDASSYRVGNDTPFTINLRFYNQDATGYRTLLVADNYRQRSLGGTVYVDGSCSKMRVVGGINSVATIESTFSGEADFGFANMWDGTTGEIFKMYGDNSGLTGVVTLSAAYNKTKKVWNDMTVAFTNAAALGGALKKANRAGLRLEYFPRLRAEDSVVYDTANRHIFGLDGMRVDVAEGKTFTIMNDYRSFVGYSEIEEQYIPDRCSIEKTGGGVLALTSVTPCKNNEELNPATPDGLNNLVRVKEGGIEPLAATTFDNLVVDFHDGTMIVVDPSNDETAEYGLRLIANAPVFEDGAMVKFTLPAGVVPRNGVKYVFLTAPASAGDLTPRLGVVKVRTENGTYCGVITKEAVTVNDVSCYRYSATYSVTGSILLFR